MTTATPEHAAFLRRTGLEDILSHLRAQRDRKRDIVVAARDIHAKNGRIVVRGAGEPILRASGVTTPPAGELILSPAFEQGLADKLNIPSTYLRRILDAGDLDLFDHNVNAWLEQIPNTRYLVRYWRGRDGGPGIARALLSDRYKIINNLDLMVATLDGLRQVRSRFDITTDLSEKRMYVYIRSLDITTSAPELVENYRSPFTGRMFGRDNPLVSAGVVIRNSEIGASRYSITPRYVFEVCTNGMTMTADAKDMVHRGQQLPSGVVQWSDDTLRAELRLMAKQTRDTVTTFLDHEFMLTKLTEVARNAGVPLADPGATIQHISTKSGYTDAEQTTILNHFITGGDTTAGGVLHAITSTAQTVEHPDRAGHLEATALDAMVLAGQYRP